MTLKARNSILYILFGIVSACVVGFLVALLATRLDAQRILNEVDAAQGHFLGFVWKTGPDLVAINIFSAGLSVALAWTAGFLFIKIFRLASSPQLFFLILFWICMCSGIFRMFNLVAIVYSQGIGVRIAFSRADIAFRMMGALALFASSLLTIGIKGQHQGNMLLLLVGISVSMSYLFPLNIANPSQTLMFGTSGLVNDDVFCLVSGILTLLNYFKNAFSTMDNGDWALMISMAMLVTGQELQMAAGEWWLMGMAWAMILGGSVWLARRFMSSYLWY